MKMSNNSKISKRLLFLERVEKVINRYKEVGDEDIPFTKTYERYIRDEFNIGIATFRKYLGINVAKEREKINKI